MMRPLTNVQRRRRRSTNGEQLRFDDDSPGCRSLLTSSPSIGPADSGASDQHGKPRQRISVL